MIEQPKTYSGNLADPPAGLEPLYRQDRWVGWRWERINGRWTKPPYIGRSPNVHASTSDPQTWGPRYEAVSAVISGKMNGIGFCLKDSDVGAIDLDKCRNPETKQIDPWAQAIINSAKGAYVEITPSGEGLRIIGLASGPEVHRKFAIAEGREGAAVELYRRATRFITVSGLEVSRCAVLPNIDHVIDLIVSQYDRAEAKQKAGSNDGNGFDDIEDLIEHGAPEPHRSELFARCVWSLAGSGLNSGEIETLLKKHPTGIATKYIHRLRSEIDRCYAKWQRANQKAQAETTSNSAHTWDDPDWSLLDDKRGELPEFPLQVLSSDLQALIKRTAKGAGVTPAHVAVPMIGCISSLIGIARRVEATSSWRQPVTCWTAIVGNSGTGKTPGINVTKRCVKQVERDNKDRDDARRRAHETKKESAKAASALWKRAVEEATAAGLPVPPMPIEAMDAGKYIAPKLYVSDGTIERLAELLQARPQGILFLRDELSALFSNMSRYSNGQDNEFWLEAWNGDSFNVERMGRTTHVDHLLIGICGGMQPDKLVKSFEGDHDGMYARVLYSWPSETWCDLTDEAGELEPDIQNIIGRINKLAEVTPEGTLVIRDIRLSPEAREGFAQFRQWVFWGKDAYEGREREWWSKMTAHVLRLAGTLTYLPWAMEGGTEPVAIDKSAMAAAIVLTRDYFWPHAKACLRQIGLTERHAHARRVLRWLRANHKTEVSREDVRRDALSQRLDADQTTALLASLCNAGWLRETVIPSGPRGGMPARRWLVNPKLSETPIAETAETPGSLG